MSPPGSPNAVPPRPGIYVGAQRLSSGHWLSHRSPAMRTATFFRAGSPLGSPRSVADGSHGPLLPRSRSGFFFPVRSSPCAAGIRLEAEGGRKGPFLRRARSEADLFVPVRSPRAGLRSSPVPEMVSEEEEDVEVKWCDLPAPVPMMEYSGGGTGEGRNVGGGRGGEEGDDRSDSWRISVYYQQMLRADPSNPLLLRNYGRFLHEVEGDAKGAAECYGRAILTSPGDGEVLSLYGKLVWETHKDGERAESYFERAVQASPNDCYVLGSYAHFLWDAEEDEEEQARTAAPASPLVEAF